MVWCKQGWSGARSDLARSDPGGVPGLQRFSSTGLSSASLLCSHYSQCLALLSAAMVYWLIAPAVGPGRDGAPLPAVARKAFRAESAGNVMRRFADGKRPYRPISLSNSASRYPGFLQPTAWVACQWTAVVDSHLNVASKRGICWSGALQRFTDV